MGGTSPSHRKKIVEDGHEIGSMGYEYKNYTELERGKIIRDLAQAKKVFDTLGIKHTPFLRAPTGNFNKNVLKVVHSFGHTVVHWSVDSKDWLNPGVHAIVENVTKTLKAVILCCFMHQIQLNKRPQH